MKKPKPKKQDLQALAAYMKPLANEKPPRFELTQQQPGVKK